MAGLAARQRAAIDVLANYLSAEVEESLRASYEYALSRKCGVESDFSASFTALQAYLDRMAVEAALHASAAIAAGPSIASTSGPAKQTGKKKAPTKNSRGVDALKKVSTKGIKPISSFFKKS